MTMDEHPSGPGSRAATFSRNQRGGASWLAIKIIAACAILLAFLLWWGGHL